MKSIYNTFILLICLLSSTAIFATGKFIDKEKVIDHTYTISDNSEINLDNQFGDVNIKYWNKKEVKLNIIVKASSNSESKVMRILDAIEVIHNQSGDDVYVETKIAKNSKLTKNNDYKENGFSITYTISMPSKNALNVKNSFGDIDLDDHIGELDVNLQFGGITAGDLKNVNNFDLQFGDAEIKSINADDISVQFSSIDIDEVYGSVDISLGFCKKSTIRMGSNVDDVYIKVEHSNIDLVLPSDLSAEFSMSTSFGKLKNNSSYDLKDTTKKPKYGPSFDREYVGQSGSGKNEFRVKSSFSTITIR